MSEGYRFTERRRGEALRAILQRALVEHGISRSLPRRIAPEVWETAVGKQMAARAQLPACNSHSTTPASWPRCIPRGDFSQVCSLACRQHTP